MPRTISASSRNSSSLYEPPFHDAPPRLLILHRDVECPARDGVEAGAGKALRGTTAAGCSCFFLRYRWPRGLPLERRGFPRHSNNFLLRS